MHPSTEDVVLQARILARSSSLEPKAQIKALAGIGISPAHEMGL